MSRILVVEDTRPIAQGIRTALEQEGYDVRIAGDGEVALETIRHWEPHLIVLDLILPVIDGLQVLRTLRAEGFAMPVLILSARGDEGDRVRGLRIGADDYLPKPFGLDELLARVDAHLRREARAFPARPATGPDADIALGSLRVCASTRTATWAGVSLALRPREFDLLHALARRRGHVVTRLELLREVWGYDSDVESRTIDTHILEVRRKLEGFTGGDSLIVTVRKAGYRLAVPGDGGQVPP